MVGSMPAESIDHYLAIKKRDLHLLLFGDDLAQQDSFMRRLRPMVMLGFLISHGLPTVGRFRDIT